MEILPHLPQTPAHERDWHQALMDLARYLRTPEGCPWDQQQTARSFAEFHVEESAEYVEALDGDDHHHMAEECGDALFTLLASVAAAEAEGLFTYEEMLQRAHEKMIRRHDHVFGEEKARTPEEAMEAWERSKAAERARKNGERP
jgi:tetrapyrrole methylase family protein/MazG family protein